MTDKDNVARLLAKAHQRMETTMKTPDTGLARVRAVRTKISREFGNDPAKLVDHYIEFQKQFEERLCDGPSDEDTDQVQDAAEPAHAP